MIPKTLHFLDEYLPLALAETIEIAWAPIKPIADFDQEAYLSDEELAEWRGFDHEDRRLEFATTRRLIHKIVKQLSIDESLFTLKKDEWGKPYGFCEGITYPISIAHTRQHVLCGVSMAEQLGVDLEPVDRNVHARLRDRILNAAEESLLAGETTLRIWTIKEALVKLQGRGMRMNLSDCIITAKREDQFTAKFNDDKTAKICSFEQDKNWMAFAWNS